MKNPVCVTCGKVIEPARAALGLPHCENCAHLIPGNPLRGGDFVFVSGCYDIVHGGHIEFFTQARALGTRLIVCIPTEEVFLAHKNRPPVLPVEHKLAVIGALKMVDEVVVGGGQTPGLNFANQFSAQREKAKAANCGLILAVTDDDKFEDAKRRLCQAIGALYVQLPKSLGYTPVSSSALAQRLRDV